MAKRGKNEGTMFKRQRSGKTVWVGQVSLGVDDLGRRKRRTVYGETQEIVRDKIDELRQKVQAGIDLEQGRDTLAAFWTDWLAGKEVRSGTRATYQALWTLHIEPYLGGERLEAITPRMLIRWQSDLRAELRKREEKRKRKRGQGDTTRVHAFKMLRQVLQSAVRMNSILYNPAERMDPPRPGKARKPLVLDHEQTRALLAACDGHPFEAFVLLGVLHGLRFGEIAGLTWGALDLPGKVVRVEASLIEDRKGKRQLGDPKSDSSRRDVPLSELAVAALRRHKARLPGPPHPKRLVFTQADGSAIRRSNFHRREWSRIRKAAGIGEIGFRFHDTRHTSASTQLANGAALTTVSGTLGHSSPAVTMRIYAHALPSKKRESAELVDRLFG